MIVTDLLCGIGYPSTRRQPSAMIALRTFILRVLNVVFACSYSHWSSFLTMITMERLQCCTFLRKVCWTTTSDAATITISTTTTPTITATATSTAAAAAATATYAVPRSITQSHIPDTREFPSEPSNPKPKSRRLNPNSNPKSYKSLDPESRGLDPMNPKA